MATIGTPPTPAPNTQGLSGTTWVSGGGHTTTSGLDPIDYAEYTQWMTIEYTRNPTSWGLWDKDSTEFRSLTHASATASGNINGTYLHFKITAYNSCRLLHNNFTLSSYTQPQKIALQSNKVDKAGYTYGEVSGTNNLYVFGPQGSIITTQPFIRRDPKKATDVPYTFMQVGTGFATQVSAVQSGGGQPWGFLWGDGADISVPYKDYLALGGPTHGDVTNEKFPYIRDYAGGMDYFGMYGGGYNTSSEPGFGDNVAGANRLIQFINTNCDLLNEPGLGFDFWLKFIVPLPMNSDGEQWPQTEDRLAVNPYYNTSRHDYS